MALRILTLLSLVLLASDCSPSPGGKPVAASPQTRKWSQEVHRRLNTYRQAKGLPALRYHQGIEQLCLNHSEWLRQKRGQSFMHGSNVSHSGSHYRARVSRIQYGMEAWGENVAYISNTPNDVAKHLIIMWKGSSSHNKAMVGNWTHAATGIVVDEDGAVFATMNFGRQEAKPSTN